MSSIWEKQGLADLRNCQFFGLSALPRHGLTKVNVCFPPDVPIRNAQANVSKVRKADFRFEPFVDPRLAVPIVTFGWALTISSLRYNLISTLLFSQQRGLQLPRSFLYQPAPDTDPCETHRNRRPS